MALLSLLIIAIIQGFTEFLPVSSSGHLVLIHDLLGENSEELWARNRTLDVAVHVGTLLSVLVYFRQDVAIMIRGIFPLLLRRYENPAALLNMHLLIASLPVIIAGFLIFKLEPQWLHSLEIMAWATLIFGVILGIADKIKPSERDFSDINFKSAAFIGLSQILALIPGTSRSGITMTAARALGFNRTSSARFSLLMSIIAIAGAGALATKDLVEQGDIALGFDSLLAALMSFITGWISISLMMKWLEKASFMPFAIYRVILGTALLALIYTGIL